MQTIQTMIQEFYRNAATDQKAAEELAAKIVEAVMTQETLLAAWYPGTKQFFITKEFGQNCAVLFSERDIFERFAQACMDKGLDVAAVESHAGDREALFAELWMCGFTRVIVDFAPYHLNMPISNFVDIPDIERIPPAQRPAPRMNGKLLYLMQEIHAGTAEGGQELEVLAELAQSEFLTPVIRQPDAAVQIPFQAAEDGKRMALLFTDRMHWNKVIREDALTPSVVRFQDIRRLMAQGCDAVVINPQSGAELMLDAPLLAAAEKAAAGETEGMKLHSLREEEKITATEPDRIPEEMQKRITACLQNHPEVKKAWLRMLHKDSQLLPLYLLVTEVSGGADMKPVFREIADAALHYAEGRGIECAVYEDGTSDWVGDAKPFYRKKRFGFLK